MHRPLEDDYCLDVLGYLCKDCTLGTGQRKAVLRFIWEYDISMGQYINRYHAGVVDKSGYFTTPLHNLIENIKLVFPHGDATGQMETLVNMLMNLHYHCF